MVHIIKGICIIVFVSLIPTIGIVVGSLVSSGYESQHEEAFIKAYKEERGIDLTGNQQVLNQIKLRGICNQSEHDEGFNAICDELYKINRLTYYSLVTLIFTISVFVFIFSIGLLSRQNRNILFYLFRPGLFILQISAAILVAANAGILVFSIYFAESFYLGRVHILLIGGTGILAGIVAISVLVQAFIPIKDIHARVLGKVLNKDTYPTLWNFVEALAKKIGTEVPNTIIAGLEPTFFVTEADVLCIDGTIQGRTLFISLPICRAISKSEFSAIVGHEMGHFIGKDTKWSKKFYPIYRGATNTIFSLDRSDSENGLAQIALMPALIFMSIFINAFEKSEKAISRQRELNADLVGLKTTSKEEMGSALVKAHLYQYVWAHTQQQMEKTLSDGKQIINLSEFCDTTYKSISRDFMKDEIGGTHTAHPMDSHPSLSIRLNSMGIKIDEIYDRGIQNMDGDQAITLIDEAETLEEELTDLEYYKLTQ